MARSAVAGRPAAAAAASVTASSSSSPLVLLLTLFCFFGFSLVLDDFWLLPGAALNSAAALLAEMPLSSSPLAATTIRVRSTAARRRYTTTSHRPSSSSLWMLRAAESPAPRAFDDGPVPVLGPKPTYPAVDPGLPHHLDVCPISRYRGVSAFYRAVAAARQTAGPATNHGPRPPRPGLFGPLAISPL